MIEEIRMIIDADDKKMILSVLENVKKRLTDEEHEKQQELKRLALLIDMIGRSNL